jgi:hypothetical protein
VNDEIPFLRGDNDLFDLDDGCLPGGDAPGIVFELPHVRESPRDSFSGVGLFALWFDHLAAHHNRDIIIEGNFFDCSFKNDLAL